MNEPKPRSRSRKKAVAPAVAPEAAASPVALPPAMPAPVAAAITTALSNVPGTEFIIDVAERWMGLGPARVMTGTPIHKACAVTVAPV